MDYMKSRWLMNRTETVLCFKVCLTWRVECYTKCVVKMMLVTMLATAVWCCWNSSDLGSIFKNWWPNLSSGLGWFTAYLAPTKRQNPILRAITEILTMNLRARLLDYTRYHHRQSLWKNAQQFFFHFKFSNWKARFFDFSVMLNMAFWNSHKLWRTRFHTISWTV